jgi:hypothetical protein
VSLTDIIASKTVTVRFSVADGDRSAIEAEIEIWLRLAQEIVWEDDPEGIKVVCVSRNSVWRPRRKFRINNQLLIEGKS